MSVADVIAGERAWWVECADSLIALPTLPEACIDAVVTDPPYSSGGMFRADRVNVTTDEKYTQSEHQGRRPNFSGDNMDQRAWSNWCHRWLSDCRRVSKEGGHLCCFSDWRQLPILTDVVQWAGWVWRGVLTWDKTEAAKGPHTGYFGYQCEFIVWATNGPCLRRPSLGDGGEGRMPGCYRRAVSQSDKHHQTGKPTDVMKWLTRCCPPGGLCLDPFAGSATTGSACLRTNRRFVGLELDPTYHAVAVKRLARTEEDMSLSMFKNVESDHA